MMNLPEDFCTRISVTFPDGAAWLKRLPYLVAAAARRWNLEPGTPVPNLSYNYVAPARRQDGTPCILKIGVPNRELTSEITALRLYAGDGACRLLEADADAGMLVLERLFPGTMLHEGGTDEEQTAVAARVMKRLWQPAPAAEPLIPLKEWFDELKELRPRFANGTGPFPRRLVEATESLLPDLFAASGEQVLLHGDCHHFNILDSERGWLAIDPKGVTGPAGYDPTPLLFNPWEDFIHFPDAVEITQRRIRTLAEVLDLDPKNIHAWAVCHSLLSAWWDLTESNTGGEYSMACGEIFLRVRV
jgi:streptomycin 6-kinase